MGPRASLVDLGRGGRSADISAHRQEQGGSRLRLRTWHLCSRPASFSTWRAPRIGQHGWAFVCIGSQSGHVVPDWPAGASVQPWLLLQIVGCRLMRRPSARAQRVCVIALPVRRLARPTASRGHTPPALRTEVSPRGRHCRPSAEKTPSAMWTAPPQPLSLTLLEVWGAEPSAVLPRADAGSGALRASSLSISSCRGASSCLWSGSGGARAGVAQQRARGEAVDKVLGASSHLLGIRLNS